MSPVAWKAFLALAAGASLLRVLAGATPLVPLIDAAWGRACGAAMGAGILFNRERGRIAWSLFSISILCGPASMVLYPAAQGDATLGAARDVLDVRRLRADVPAVICSGWAAEEVSGRLAATPGTIVLEKPYAPPALVAAIDASRVAAREAAGDGDGDASTGAAGTTGAPGAAAGSGG